MTYHGILQFIKAVFGVIGLILLTLFIILLALIAIAIPIAGVILSVLLPLRLFGIL